MGLVRFDLRGAVENGSHSPPIHGLPNATLPPGRIRNRFQRRRQLSPRTPNRRSRTPPCHADLRRQINSRPLARRLDSFFPRDSYSRVRLDDGPAIPFPPAFLRVVSSRRIFLHSHHRLLLLPPHLKHPRCLASDTSLRPIPSLCPYPNLPLRHRPPQSPLRVLRH